MDTNVYVLGLQDVDTTNTSLVGGKGANLGELARIEGVRVPEGFCVSTRAFKRILDPLAGLLDPLARLTAQQRDEISEHSAAIRQTIEAIAIPDDIRAAITHELSRFGDSEAFAVRSSATAEDLPTASFAGQHDTYLNVVGTPAILEHIRRCWASLFTDRAVTYRVQHGFDHRHVHLAVVVQQMIAPQVAGILFTADPVTSSRKVSSIDASFGLGEALVSGLVNADTYKVRDGRIVDRKVATKKLAIRPVAGGGTERRPIEPELQNAPALTDEQILRLERLGRTIEAHFGQPQDIEWALVDDSFHVVQSRPITTLFPIPDANDRENHVYVSVGHQQMMTAPLKPLGLSLFQRTAVGTMFSAAGRLFVDVARHLASPTSRETIMNVLGTHDPLIGDALTQVLARGDFVPSLPDDEPRKARTISPAGFRSRIDNDPTIVTDLIQRAQASLAAVQQTIQSKSGPELIDFILDDLQQLKQQLADPRSSTVYLAAMDASHWINENMKSWLGETNAADTLTQSVPNNVTSEMGLDLLDVADVVRRYPDVIAYLQRVDDDFILDELVELEGGHETRDSLAAYLDKYGMRCVGEIDITRPRWSEKPATLVPLILNHVRNFEPGASRRKFEQGRQEASNKERELLDRLRQLPDGESKADETARMISLVRTFIGYREYPKYSLISRYFVYKQALVREAERLVRASVLHDKEDIYWLTFDELRDVVRTNQLDDQIIRRRKYEHEHYERLTPPRVITSDGDVPAAAYKRDHLPAGALVGLAVSSGVIEGRARVIASIEAAALEDGDILVTAFTDPSWTPLFVSIKGLVTEVGGLMTHGAVIAREYGIPAVVGVPNATTLIKDGQRIRVHGGDGYVEVL
ncbi:MAG TPA: rifamycin-inactivating phosphotransferase [Kofleriaceae bacterium]